VSARLADQRGAAVLAAIEAGLAVPDRDLPRFPRGARRVVDPDFDRRVERLKDVRNAAAGRLELDPGVLCPKGTLEAVARARPATASALAEVSEMRKWQVEVLGAAFLQALSGQPSPK